MKIPEDPWIVLAAERFVALERAHRNASKAGRHAANGTDEHISYVEALNGAYASEGLTPHTRTPNGDPVTDETHPLLRDYGTEEERDRVRLRILGTAVHLLIEEVDR
jgi:hypothetical protein